MTDILDGLLKDYEHQMKTGNNNYSITQEDYHNSLQAMPTHNMASQHIIALPNYDKKKQLNSSINDKERENHISMAEHFVGRCINDIEDKRQEALLRVVY